MCVGVTVCARSRDVCVRVGRALGRCATAGRGERADVECAHDAGSHRTAQRRRACTGQRRREQQRGAHRAAGGRERCGPRCCVRQQGCAPQADGIRADQVRVRAHVCAYADVRARVRCSTLLLLVTTLSEAIEGCVAFIKQPRA
jgi:hypothetical protein